MDKALFVHVLSIMRQERVKWVAHRLMKQYEKRLCELIFHLWWDVLEQDDDYYFAFHNVDGQVYHVDGQDVSNLQDMLRHHPELAPYQLPADASYSDFARLYMDMHLSWYSMPGAAIYDIEDLD